MSERSRPEFDADWIRAMVAKEEELGSLPPGGATGGFGAKRGTSSPMNDLRAAVARADEVLGCGAMPCRFKDTTGQTTNGRCVCLDHPRAGHMLAALYKTAKRLLEEPSKASAAWEVLNAQREKCWCQACNPPVFVDHFPLRLFIVCHQCGNKRCPRAASHDNACSGSNEPGQDGSKE